MYAVQTWARIAQERPSYSFDLTAATDRLPIDLQVQILSDMGVRWAKAWRVLLTKRPWYLGSKQIMYSVGQPMGAYSSWAMLALTHHVIVQVAAYRVGWGAWFPYYALLGDVIVIRDAMVAGAYSSLMPHLRVPINMSKALVSETGSLEFAERWIHPDLGEFSPLGPGLILVTVRNLRFIPLIVHELITKNFGFMQMRLKDLIQLIGILRCKTPSDLPMLVSLLSLGPSGGLWGSGQLSSKAAAWITSYRKDTNPDVLSTYLLCAVRKSDSGHTPSTRFNERSSAESQTKLNEVPTVWY